MIGETVTRVRRTQTGVDRYKNPIYTTADTPLEGALFDPGSSSQTVVVGGVTTATSPTLYFPGTRPDIREDDAIRVRGVLYQVDGHPADWQSPWGSDLVGGLVVPLELAQGGGA